MRVLRRNLMLPYLYRNTVKINNIQPCKYTNSLYMELLPYSIIKFFI
nr:hypothetical protein TDPV-217 [Oriental turtle dovepox virus]